MSVRLSYVVSNMRNEMSPSQSYVVSNMRNEMKCISVCYTWFPIWGMKWNVCPSVIRGFQYEGWNEMSVRLSYVISNMRNEMSPSQSYVVSNMRNEMKCISVCYTWFPIWGMKWNVCPSVIRGFQYEGWNEMSVRLSHSWFPIWGMKWNVYLSVIRGFQYKEWNEM